MPPSPAEFCHAVNTLGAWLALDDFAPVGPSDAELADLDAILLFGNQAVATLTAACTLACRATQARLLFSGGVGHSTALLYENLRRSTYGSLLDDASIRAGMAEAEIYASVAQRAFHLPASRILIEAESRHTGENARFSLRTLAAQGIGGGKILLLQDPTMQRRSVLTWRHEAEQAGMLMEARSHAAFVPQVALGGGAVAEFAPGPSRNSWTLPRFFGLLMGEVERLRDDENGYGPQGKNFLPHVEIPATVLESYRQLAEAASQAAR